MSNEYSYRASAEEFGEVTLLSSPVSYAYETKAATEGFDALDDAAIERIVANVRETDAGVQAGAYSAEAFEDWLARYRRALYDARGEDARREAAQASFRAHVAKLRARRAAAEQA